MNSKITFTKKDMVVTLACVLFLILTLGAIGSGGRKAAKATLCLSNLRQWGQAFGMYLKDNEGFFMKSTVNDAGGSVHYKWMNMLYPYYKDEKLLLCPEATKPYDQGGKTPFAAWRWELRPPSPEPREVIESATGLKTGGYVGSYGSNTYIYNRAHNVYWRTVNVKGAGNVPMLLDCANIGGRPGEYDEPPEYDGFVEGDCPGCGYEWMQVFALNRHSGKTNCLFMDFSVRPVGLKELWALKWSRQYDTCGEWTTSGGAEPNDWPVWMRGYEDY